ncbi:hypothetical protein ACWD4G_11720 [Streptomyces sp. NPDC002643]
MRLTGLVLVAGLLLVLVAGTVPYGYAAGPDPATSWAGSRAGEGRERPGRQGIDPTEPEEADPSANADSSEAPGEPDGPEAGVSPEPSQNAALPVPSYGARNGHSTPDEQVLRALALGGGLILMGLGLGLAFVGLRIRRT